MAVPENYRRLGNVGTAYKGEYDPKKQYKYRNEVYYEGSTYIALKDNPEGPPVHDGVNWNYSSMGASGGAVDSVNGKTGKVELSAEDVKAIPDTEKGKPSGVATLGKDGKVPKDQLPDDISTDLSVVSDKFSPDKKYAAGEYCIKDNMLYKFTKPKETGEWDDSVVEATNVGRELNSNTEWFSSNISFKNAIGTDRENTTAGALDVLHSQIRNYSDKSIQDIQISSGNVYAVHLFKWNSNAYCGTVQTYSAGSFNKFNYLNGVFYISKD